MTEDERKQPLSSNSQQPMWGEIVEHRRERPTPEVVDAELVSGFPTAAPGAGGYRAGASGPHLHTERPRVRNRRRKFAVITVGVLCIGVVVAGIYRVRSQLAGPRISATPSLRLPLTKERAAITKQLDGTWQVPEDDARYREMVGLLKKLEHANASQESGRFTELVEWKAHMERFYKVFRFQPVNPFIRFQLETYEREQFAMPVEASNFKIASIEERTKDDWYVYTYAQDGDLANAPFLFHMRRQKGTWKLVDWADVAELRWDSEYNGIAAGLATGDRAWEQQNRLSSAIEQSDRLLDGGNTKASETMLQQAESIAGIPELQATNLYLLAVRWHALGNPAEAERLLRSIWDRDSYPWSYYLLAIIHSSRGEHVEALDAIHRFEANVGFFHDLAVIKTECYVALGQSEEAERSALSLVRHAPHDDESLTLARQHVSAARFGEVLKLLPDDPDRAASLEQTARMALYEDATDKFQVIREYLAEQFPEDSRAQKLDAEYLHYQGELEAALAIYRRLIEASDSPELQSNYLALLLQTKSVREVYENASDPAKTLELLTEEIAYDEAYISVDQLEEILPLHRERSPEDPNLPRYAALVAMAKQNWPEAVEELEKAIELARGQEDGESLVEELTSTLLEARYRMGDGIAALREAEDRAAAFQSLAPLMESSRDWDALAQLIEVYGGASQDLWARYYDLVRQEGKARESNNEEQLVALLPQFEALRGANQQNSDIYPALIDNRIEAIATAGSRWKVYLESQSEPERLVSSLMMRFRRERNSAAIEELLAFLRQRLPDSETLKRFEIEQLADQQNHAGIIAYCAAQSAGASSSSAVDLGLREQLLVSYLMEGNTSEAWKLASSPTPNTRLQWLVRLAEGNPESLRNFVNEHRGDPYWQFSIGAEARRIPMIERFVQSGEFQRLRTELPLALHGDYLASRAIVFFPKPVAWTEDLIRERLAGVGLADVEVEQLAQPPLATETFRIRRGSDEWLLTCQDGAYITARDLASNGDVLNRTFAEQLAQHQHWVALEPQRVLRDHDDPTWLRLISASVGEASAIWGSWPYGASMQLVITPEIAQQLTADATLLRTLALPAADTAYLFQSIEEDGDVPPGPWYARCHAAAHGGKPGRVMVHITRGHAREQLWLDVVAVIPMRWGNYAIEAKCQASSTLEPLFSSGTLLRLSQGEIQEWEE